MYQPHPNQQGYPMAHGYQPVTTQPFDGTPVGHLLFLNIITTVRRTLYYIISYTIFCIGNVLSSKFLEQ